MGDGTIIVSVPAAHVSRQVRALEPHVLCSLANSAATGSIHFAAHIGPGGLTPATLLQRRLVAGFYLS